MVGRILLIILGILLLLILLIFFVPYGVDAGYEEGVLFLRVKAGPFRFTLYPKKPPSERKKKKQREKQDAAGSEKKADETKKKKKKEKKKGEPADTAEQGVDETITVREKTKWDLDTIAALAKMALNALRRFFRAFRVDFLKLHLTVAGSDPYDTALRYGAVCAAAEMLNADNGRCPDVSGDRIPDRGDGTAVQIRAHGLHVPRGIRYMEDQDPQREKSCGFGAKGGRQWKTAG